MQIRLNPQKDRTTIVCDKTPNCANCKKVFENGDTAYLCEPDSNVKGIPLLFCDRFSTTINKPKFNCKTDFSRCKPMAEHTHYCGIIEIDIVKNGNTK